MTTDYSRVVKAAAASGTDDDGVARRLEKTPVHITCDSSAQLPTLTLLLANLRRLPIVIHLSPINQSPIGRADLDALLECAAAIDPDRPVLLNQPPEDALRLHVGMGTTEADISAIPHGHGTRIRRNGHRFPGPPMQASGLGRVLTAAMLTAEAFKTIIGVHPSRHRLVHSLDFNPVTLQADGPMLAFDIIRDVALIGVGAIGSAIGLILRESGIEGALTAVDPEQLEPPNVTTYSLGSQQDAATGIPKTELLSQQLPHIDVLRVEGTAQDFIAKIDAGDAPMPTMVLSAVDSIQARHESAKIYADITLDGSTGGLAGTTIGLAEAVPEGPCLRCYYPSVPQHLRPSPEEQLSAMTGLDITVLADGNRTLSNDDLRGLSPTGHQLLGRHVGKPICGLARSLGLLASEDSYRPSAIFASQQAAALVVGAFILRNNSNSMALRDVEYDTLFGPLVGMTAQRHPITGCTCRQDGTMIQRVRRSRKSLQALNTRG
ncbi:MAG: ThiF family adenylyltransferase [Mycobacterium sp.]|nr:ThiF family adenylyltransferase [Mycobacterium sp.]